jgi:hypothetical protein
MYRPRISCGLTISRWKTSPKTGGCVGGYEPMTGGQKIIEA